MFTGGSSTDQLAGERDTSPTRTPIRRSTAILRTQDAYTWLEEAPYPTIAAVHGYALGAGLQLALACDIRVFARGTKVGLLEHKYGILPTSAGRNACPASSAPGRRRSSSGPRRASTPTRPTASGCANGSSTRGVEAERRALAEQIAAQPPLAVRGAKRAVEAAGRLPVRDGLVVEAEAQAVCLTFRRHARGDHRVRRAATQYTATTSGAAGAAGDPSEPGPRHRPVTWCS